MKINMKTKTSILLILSVFFINPIVMTIAHAEDAPVSAPQVVAPAQPAGQATINTNNTGTTAAAPAQAAAPSPSITGMLLPFGIMLVIMYFLMIRPQQKKMKDHQALITQLKSGDEVVTNAGIIGTITGLTEKVVTIEISKNVQMKVLKSQVNQVVKGSIPELQA